MAGSNVYDQIISGSFNALNPGVAEMYAGIYPPASSSPPPSYQSGMLGRGQPSTVGSPYLTAAEQQQLAQQIAASQALQASTGQRPTAVATGPSWNTPTSIDLAAINATKSKMPGPSLESLLSYAKALPDKTAANPAVAAATAAANPNNVSAATNPQTLGGLFHLLFGGGGSGGAKAGGMGLLSLLPQAQPQAPRTLSYSMPGLTPSQSYSKANQDAIARASASIGGTGGSSSRSSSGGSSSNLGGVSSSGRRYDYDNNQWV